jgi:hypothetical protein
LNSLHPSFAFATPTVTCSQHGPSSFVCTSGGVTGTGATEPDARANLNSKLSTTKKPTIVPKHHHVHHPHPTSPKPVVPVKPKHHHIHTPKAVPKPILVRHPLTDPTTPKPTLKTGTAPAGTGGNAIKQAQNKNQHKVITTTSPSSPIVNDVPSSTTTDTTQPQDTSSTQQDTPIPPSDPGNQTNVLLVGGAIFVGLMVLLLIV